MSKQELERIDDLGIGAWDNHKPDAFAELFADEFVLRDSTVPEPIRTRDAAAAYVQAWFTAFPDMRVRRTNRVIGEDSVAGEIEFTGTNTGPLAMGGMELRRPGRAWSVVAPTSCGSRTARSSSSARTRTQPG